MLAAGTTAPADYEVISDYLELEIPKGETIGIIELDLYSDSDFEDDETIELSIEEVDSEAIEITREDEMVSLFNRRMECLLGLNGEPAMVRTILTSIWIFSSGAKMQAQH